VNTYLESEFPFYTAYSKTVRGNSLSCTAQTSIFRSKSNDHDPTCHCLLTLLKFEFFLVLKIMKVDFDATVSAINKIFQDSVITGCNFHLNQCLWRQRDSIGLTAQCKENEQVRLICRMRAALAHQPINKVGEGWLRIMENVPYNETLTLQGCW